MMWFARVLNMALILALVYIALLLARHFGVIG